MSRSHIGLKIAIASLLMVLPACNLPFVATRTPPAPEEVSDPQVAALRQLEAASETPPDLYFQNGFPRFVSGSFRVEGADAVERARNFLETYQDLYRIANPDLGLAVRRVSEGEAETDVVFFQTYQGIEAFASEIVVTLNGERVSATVGGLLNSDVSLDVTPEIPAPQAEESARADLGLPDALVTGITTLMVFDQSMLDDVPPEAHLVWKVTISEPAPWQVFVDAQTGQVLFKYLLAQDGAGLEDYDFEEFTANGGGPGDCYYFTGDHIGSEDGLERALHSDPEAVGVWWFARDAYLFYHDTFGRHSFDNDDSQLEVFIRADASGGRASWIYFCNLIIFEVGWVGQDILTHEFTHGVIASTSDLVYANQPGALNESYADVMGALLDGNWTIGEGRVGGGGAIRDLSNPPAFGHPDLYINFFRTSRDNGGVHTNSGIPNKAAYLIAAGDTFNGWTITGIGTTKMGALFYGTMTSLGSGAQMIDARNATVGRADRYALSGASGFTAFDACQVQNAYAAVGLGDGDTDCDGTNDATDTDADGDYIPDSRDNCTLVDNPSQLDTDGDGRGNACDTDNDNDSVSNATDNCPLVVNPRQEDRDGDGIGDACEDEDGDGVLESRDNCPGVANSDQYNFDRDETGNACDTDDDNDGLPDATDNCPRAGYGEGYRDQTDRDGDGVGDYCDNARDVPNPDQADSDGDRIADAADNCPTLANFYQEDSDRDGIGDRCDGDNYFDLIPDGSLSDVSIRGGPGQVQNVPIPVCKANNCPDWFLPDYLVSIVLTCPPPNVGVWVTDDTGKSVGKSPYKGDLRVLRFLPVGGRSYFLNFVFGPDFPEGGQASCSASMSAGPADEQPNPTPSGPTPNPLPAPPAWEGPETIATLTPTLIPTLTPTFTPTAQLAAQVIPTLNAYCRKGPGTLYDQVTVLQKGTAYNVIGRDSQNHWWQIQVPGSKDCWVGDSNVGKQGPVEQVSIVQGLPLPGTPASFVNKFVCDIKAKTLGVDLNWAAAQGVTGYRIYRNGDLLATVAASQTSYHDDAPLEVDLVYELEAFNNNGVAARISTSVPACK